MHVAQKLDYKCKITNELQSTYLNGLHSADLIILVTSGQNCKTTQQPPFYDHYTGQSVLVGMSS